MKLSNPSCKNSNPSTPLLGKPSSRSKIAFLLFLWSLPALLFCQQHPPLPEQAPSSNTNTEAVENTLEETGDSYGRQRNWEKAAEYYKKLTLQYPQTANYHYKYGGVLGMMALENKWKALGLMDDLKNAFKKAAELDPRHKPARWALIELYTQLPGMLGGSFKKAWYYADQLERLQPVEGYLAKGYVSESRQNTTEAKSYYYRALKSIDTVKTLSLNEWHYRLGKRCSDDNVKMNEGIRLLQTYIRRFSVQDRIPLYEAYYALAKLYRQQHQKEQAQYWIEKALLDKPGYANALAEKDKIEAL